MNLSHPPNNPIGGYHCCLHFTHGETEAERQNNKYKMAKLAPEFIYITNISCCLLGKEIQMDNKWEKYAQPH